MVFSFMGGFLVGSYVNRQAIPIVGNSQSTGLAPVVVKDKSAIISTTQSASITGKIIEVKERSIIVQSEDGKKAELEVNLPLVLNRFDKGPKDSQVVTDTKLIEKNKIVVVGMVYSENKYKVSNITYIPTSNLVTTKNATDSNKQNK